MDIYKRVNTYTTAHILNSLPYIKVLANIRPLFCCRILRLTRDAHTHLNKEFLHVQFVPSNIFLVHIDRVSLGTRTIVIIIFLWTKEKLVSPSTLFLLLLPFFCSQHNLSPPNIFFHLFLCSAQNKEALV